MLHIHRAERLDRLVDALGDLLLRTPTDPFAPDIVAVPTRGVERWVSQRLSHRLGVGLDSDGVCANVEFPSPGDLVGRVRSEVLGEPPGQSEWRPERLRWTVLQVIDSAGHATALGGLDEHLRGGGDGYERRMLVATDVAEAFHRYAMDRPGMLVDWAGGRDTDGAGAALDPDLIWQAEIYRMVRQALGQGGPAELLDTACAALVDRPDIIDLPARVSVLGPTRLTWSELRILSALADGRDVHLWLPHPSASLWSRLSEGATSADDPAPGDLPSRRRTDTSIRLVRLPLLAGLGRDSRELQLRLGALPSKVRDEYHPHGTREATLLGRLQHALAEDSADTVAHAAAQDPSVQVHACHGPSRQVEVLREVVVGLLQDDPTLEPRDVLVMVPDVEEYAPLITATFGLTGDAADGVEPAARHPGQHLRVRLADRSLRQTNPVLGVAADLLDLADGRLRASELVDLASAGPVRERFSFSDDDLDRLRTWVPDTGIRWGQDPAHRARAGLPGVTENTWRAGLDRLLLGVAMSEDEHVTVGGVLPLDDVGSQDIELAGRVAEYVERVGAATAALSGPQPLTSWASALSSALDALTAVRPADQWLETAARRELGDAVVDAGPQAAVAPLDLGDVRALFADRLGSRPTRASFRTGDLTVCSLVPMRAVPHRVVCVVGLDDGVFPRAGVADGDDVLQRDPVIGERDVRSEDRQILLDAIHAATDILVLLYSGADPRTNERRPPSVPLGEVLDALVMLTGGSSPGGSGPQGAREVFITRQPLQPFDARNFVRGDLHPDRAFSFDRHSFAGAARSRMPRASLTALSDVSLTAQAHEPDADLALDDLIRFVELPAQAFLRQRLGVTVVRDEPHEVDDILRVDADGLARWGVADRLLTSRLAGADSGGAVAAERVRGLLPPGRLGDQILSERAAFVEEIVTEAERLGLPDPTTVDVSAPARRRTVVGTVPGVRGRTITRVMVSTIGAKHRLRAWVQLVALTVSEPGHDWASCIIGRTRNGVGAVVLRPVPTPVAQRSLDGLVDLHTRGMCRPLPVAPKTSEAYARRRASGSRQHAAETAAAAAWESGRFAGECAEPANRLVWGSAAPFEELLRERGDGLPGAESEGHLFGALARVLWDDLLSFEEGAA